MKKEKLNFSTLELKKMTKTQLHKIKGGDTHHMTPSKSKGKNGGFDPLVYWVVSH